MQERVGNKEQVKAFWNRNVCQADLAQPCRGTQKFFDEIESVRYRYHYHLPPLFDEIKICCGSSGKLLEIGCGMGTDLIQLARRGVNVTGIDLTEEGIALAKQRFHVYGLDANLRVADAENLPFPDNTFETVYSFGVLHHTPDTPEAIREAHRVLKHGGTAYIMLYHRNSLNYIVHRLTGIPLDGNKNDQCPVEKAYNKKELRDLFHMFQHTEIKIDYLFGTGWGVANKITPRFIHQGLGHIIGWHAMIKAKKS